MITVYNRSQFRKVPPPAVIVNDNETNVCNCRSEAECECPKCSQCGHVVDGHTHSDQHE